MRGLRLTGLSFGYGPDWMLRDVHWSLPPGQIGAVVGPNGAGKSTLVGLVAGWLKPGAGEIRWKDCRPGTPSPRQWAQRVAVVWQDVPAQVPFTVMETVAMGRLPHGDTRSPEGQRCIREAMRLADVEGLASRPVASLSGGERQRVYLARALAQTPELLLLDEPTAHLDLAHQVQVAVQMRALAQKGTAILWASHDLNTVADTADRVLVLKEGRVLAEGPPEEVLVEAVLSRAYDCPVRVWPDPETGKPRVFAKCHPFLETQESDSSRERAHGS